jgi:surfactin synthase thioesterase subunit
LLSKWFVRPHIRPSAGLKVFCVPYAGVGASAFRGWADRFAADVEVTYIQLPGRESRLRETPIASIPAAARALAAAMEPALDCPYAMFGHSLGAVVAFETVRDLRRRGIPEPTHLFVSASRAPQLSWPHPTMGQLDDLSFLREIDSRYGGTVPRQVMESAELRELFVPSLRADLRALEAYELTDGPPLRCAISAFAGTADPSVSAPTIEEWRCQTTGRFRFRTIEGGHLFLQTARQALLDALIEDLRPSLASRAGDTPLSSH